MIVVLRLGHRLGRDSRISTHVGLVARAFGADRIIYSGEKDQKMMESVKKITEEWGGPFEVEYEKNWRRVINNFNGIKIHLTMYGIPVQEKIEDARKKSNGKDLMIIVGGEKVPGEVYDMVDYNIAITNQPHSEVAALALFLHEYFEGEELERNFEKPRIRVIPQERGKKIKKIKK